jgi:nucleotide-binding universal stress UspA family protein
LVERTKQNPDTPEDWWQKGVESAAQKIKRVGLKVSTPLKNGDPKQVLVDEATAWQADCIFLGDRGLSPIERVTLGSVSSAVAARAPCSVEVVKSGGKPATA